MVKEGVSVIICCYNSALRLPKTIKHLAKQETSIDLQWEVIIVNNASTDNTYIIAKNELLKYAPRIPSFKIVKEYQAGLNFARTRGIKEAKYDFIIFCDDDNWLDKFYISTVYSYFANNPNIAVIGGLGEPAFEEKKPYWFDNFYHGYAVGKQSLQREGDVNTVYGAGMALRKSLLESPEFNAIPMLLTDRQGSKLSAGGDSEICLRIRLLGYKVLYTEDLKFKHFIPYDRLNWQYLVKLHSGFALSYVPLHIYEIVLLGKSISSRYWLRQGLFYYARLIKYSILYFPKLKKGNIEVIRLKTWLIIGNSFMSYNTRIVQIYNSLKRLHIFNG